MSNTKNQYDIFISYRRSDGFETAQLIYDRLEKMGYRVSFDMETLRSGKFDEQLYDRIKTCRDLLIVVSKETLQWREQAENDWQRQEIAYGLKQHKNIIPVFLRDVQPPPQEELPEDVADFVMFNGVTASNEHFDSVITKICRMLHARRRLKSRFITAGISLVLLLIAAGTGSWYYIQNPIYPLTQNDKQEFSLIFTYLVQQMYSINEITHSYNKLLDAAETAIPIGDLEDFKTEKAAFENSLKNLKPAEFQQAFVEMAQRSKVIDAGDLQMFPQLYENHQEFVISSAERMEYFLDPMSTFPKADQMKLVKLNRQMENLLANNTGLSFIALMLKVKSPQIDDFKKMIAPHMTSLPVLSAAWPSRQEEIINLINNSSEKLERLLQEESTILGNLERSMNTAAQEFREQLKKQGFSDEQIERLIRKMNKNSRKKTELQEMEIRLKQAKQKAREKFSPKAEDEIGILWSKMIALKKCSLPEDALKTLDIIRQRKDASFPEKVCETAEQILKEPQNLPFVNGVIVCFFEPPATSHAIFQPGDVIVKVNDKDCLSYKDFRTAEGIHYTLYRLNRSGKFEKITPQMPANQPRTAVTELPF